MFNITANYTPFSLSGSYNISEAELKVAFKNVLDGTPEGEEAEDLLVQLFFVPGYFKTDVERAKAVVQVLELIERNTITMTTSVELENKGIPA